MDRLTVTGTDHFWVTDTKRGGFIRADRRVIGFDPATKASGWAILGLDDDRQSETILRVGVFRPVGKDRIGILAELYTWANDLIRRWDPALVAIETVCHGPNAQTTIRLAEVGAAIRLAAHHACAALLDVAPAERGASVGLEGQPGKADIQQAVKTIYGLDLKDHNAADAVAIAATGAAGLRAEALNRLTVPRGWPDG